MTGKTADSENNSLAYVTYGTKRRNAYTIIEDSLNLKDSRVYDTVTDASGKETPGAEYQGNDPGTAAAGLDPGSIQELDLEGPGASGNAV